VFVVPMPASQAATDQDKYAALIGALGRPDNRAAMERLLTDAQALAYRFSLHMCGHPEDAEDAMQEALLQTYRHAQRIRQPKGFRTWLYRTVKNACLMSRRTKSQQMTRMASLDAEGASEVPTTDLNPEEQTAAAAERRRFQAAFQQLPRPYRLVALLRDVEGLSTRETAEVVGITQANVKQRLHRARQMLKEALA
ncbi:MAG: sigma-70 family RNA polymerase sigma factor, partial [Acidobacteriota bacterium]|nr:sigma-70 family RNA polymerase sigma factor [Acidobacteriota bacterium]